MSIPAGPSMMALRDCAYGLARYAAISQVGEGGMFRSMTTPHHVAKVH